MGIEKTHGRNYDLYRLLAAIDAGQVVLPEFQRNFKWDTTAVRQLLATCLTGWPVGSLLLLPGTTDVFFRVRSIEGAPPASDEFQIVVLDGQQRLTSLYQALFGRGDFRYAVKFEDLRPGQTIEELEDALEAVPAARWVKRYSDEAAQYNAGRVPVTALRSAADFFAWRDRALPDGSAAERERLTNLYISMLSGLDRYEVPAVVIDDTVHPEAIARIFERVNRLGQPLGTFDLMVAKSYKEGFNLRDEWEAAEIEFPLVKSFLRGDGLPVLGVIALHVRDSVRQQDVLALTGAAVRDYWGRAVSALNDAINFAMQHLSVVQSDWLPYRSQLTILGCLAMNGSLAVNAPAVKSWFWTSVFRARYDVASNTRSVEDYARLLAGEPVFSGETLLDAETMFAVNRRQYGALHRGLLCLFASDRPLGIITGADLRREASNGEELDAISLVDSAVRIADQPGALLTLGMVLDTKAALRPVEKVQPGLIQDNSLESQVAPVSSHVWDERAVEDRLELVRQRLAELSALAVRVGASDSL
ncbi:DUF262 domain-containing protein [Microbacterium sp. CFH 31415]|uniref:GmrSD restriction endonuclease domain-containing protein n=1 Tax=Microbacterium sp. CFH 31415 TaxID=2921732 RepID=UPI001F137F2B|nr:DUF262 domain-containing protein [Microbacterium sp. CFH 31415]MCH6230166.1 DUF262 domain-containing protein [Microbacterium sp. CFH 31415]